VLGILARVIVVVELSAWLFVIGGLVMLLFKGPLQGRSGFGFFLLAVIISGLIVLIISLSKKSPATVEPTSFILTDSGATTWLTDTKQRRDSRSEMLRSLSVGDKRLRLGVLFACAMEAAFIVFLTVFLFQHADPRGDGMEMVGVGFAFMLIFLPFTLPALILARNGRWLVLATALAALGAFAYFGLWLEIISELGLPKA
jgi:hypothetical protein